MKKQTYPHWSYYPHHTPAPKWATDFVRLVASHQTDIDSLQHARFSSDEILAALRKSLETQGWKIEKGKAKSKKIARPVLFGDNGTTKVSYEIDGWHPKHRAVLEVESGRGWMGNAFYRDLIRTSLIQGAQYLVVGMRSSYSYGKIKDQNDFEKAKNQLDAVYASGRLSLPFAGVLLFGW